MLLKEKLSKVRQAWVQVSEQIKLLENNIIRQEVRDKTFPLALNDLIKVHDSLRDYQITLVVNDNYENIVELKKIGAVADTVLKLHFSLQGR